MSTTIIPGTRENEEPAVLESEEDSVRLPLLLAGCSRKLHDLCLALGETCRVSDVYPPTTEGGGGSSGSAPFEIMLLDPKAAHTDARQLVAGLSALDWNVGLVLVGVGTDPILELYVEFLAIHHIRVDQVLQLPSTEAALAAVLAKVRRNLPRRRQARPSAPDWKAPAAATFLFQPQFSARTLEQTGAEALARTQHPRLGLINPLQMPELRRDQRYLDDLFWEAIDQSLWALRNWSNAGYAGTVSVNVSGATLRQPDLAARLNERVDGYQLDPRRLVLELVESRRIEDDSVVFNTLLRLSQEGYLLSMDDFGQGYSSLWQLSRIPFSEIKLDHSLIARLRWSDRARKLIPAVIDLAHRLGMNIVAEGIEEQAQLDFIRRHRCNDVQGFLLDPIQEYGMPHLA